MSHDRFINTNSAGSTPSLNSNTTAPKPVTWRRAPVTWLMLGALACANGCVATEVDSERIADTEQAQSSTSPNQILARESFPEGCRPPADVNQSECKPVRDGGPLGCHMSTLTEKRFQTNLTSFAALTNFDVPATQRQRVVEHLVVKAAETWNHQTNVAKYRYMGSTSKTDLPLDYASCDAEPTSLVVFIDDEDGAEATLAEAERRCIDGDGVSRAFRIRVNRWRSPNKATPSQIAWRAYADHAEHDLLGTLTHEFGHTINLGHDRNDLTAVMDEFTSLVPEQHTRDLDDAASVCAQKLNPAREVELVTFAQNGGQLSDMGVWNDDASRSVGIDFFHTGRVLTPGCVGVSRGALQNSGECTVKEVGAGLTLTAGQSYTPAGTSLLFGSETTLTRYTRPSEEVQHNAIPARPAKVWLADESSPNIQFWCAGNSSPKCSAGGDLVWSAKGMSTAFHSGVGLPLHVWADHAPADDRYSEINVAVGQFDGALLKKPQLLSKSKHVRSEIKPAVACHPGAVAGGHDCVVAYTDQEQATGDIRFRRFSVATDGTLTADPQSYAGGSAFLRTAADVALWHNGQRFYMAVKLLTGGQPVVVMRSDDAAQWSIDAAATSVVSKVAHTSLVGPQVVFDPSVGMHILSLLPPKS